MNVTDPRARSADPTEAVVSAPFFYRGEVVAGSEQTHRSRDLGVTFATPRLELDKAVAPRTEVPPLLNVPVADIIDFLVETGQRLAAPDNDYVQECFDRMAATHVLPRSVVEAVGKHAVTYLDRRILTAELEQNFPDPRALDGWVSKRDFTGRRSFVRAFGPRLIHVLPGNFPASALPGRAHRTSSCSRPDRRRSSTASRCSSSFSASRPFTKVGRSRSPFCWSFHSASSARSSQSRCVVWKMTSISRSGCSRPWV